MKDNHAETAPLKIIAKLITNTIKPLYFQYNIKKKEEIVEAMPQEEPNPLMRKKKTPEELAAEAEQEELDDFTSKLLSICFSACTFRIQL